MSVHSYETQVFEDAFLLDTEQWEWTRLAPSTTQAQEQLQSPEQQEGLLGGGPLVPAPGFLVGHTAVLASSSASTKGGDEEMETEEEGGKGGKDTRVLFFGGQDRLGVRREELLIVKG